MEKVAVEVIRRLFRVLMRLVSIQLSFDGVIVNGEIQEHDLRNLKRTLYEMQRLDLVHLLRQAIQGNLTVLANYENYALPFLDLFHADHGAQEKWPEMCYWFSQNNNPVRKEMSIFGQDQNNERHTDMEAQSGHQRSSYRSTSVVRESGNGCTSRTHENQKAPSIIIPSATPSEHCVSCGENIEAVQRSHHVCDEITQIMNKLSPQQLQAFIKEVNHYDRDLLHSIPHNQETTFQEIIHNIVQSLRIYNLAGSKCPFCLLNYVLQRIGRLDLANEIRSIWNVTERAMPSLD